MIRLILYILSNMGQECRLKFAKKIAIPVFNTITVEFSVLKVPP